MSVVNLKDGKDNKKWIVTGLINFYKKKKY